MSSKLLGITLIFYFISGLAYLIAAAFRTPAGHRLGFGAAGIGLGLQTVALIWRWVESYQLGIGHAPLANFYESLVFFSWAVILISHLIFRPYLNAYLGGTTAWLACLLLAYASFGGHASEIMPLMPALKSNWLLIHVVTCFLAYAAFALACGAAVLFLWWLRRDQSRRPETGANPRRELDTLIYRAIIIGFFLLTLGILTGAVWAESAWGRYWSWDPKETWSLITWLIYAGLLHARLVRGWQGKRIAFLAVLGFAAVLFTYFGVSFLLPGLHAYLT